MSLRSGINKPFRIDLTNARNGKLITVKGRYVKVVDASSASAIVQIAVSENFEERYENLKKNGLIYEGQGFSKIYIKNDAQADEWVRVIVSDGPDDYDVDNPSESVIDAIATKVKVGGGNSRVHAASTVGVAAAQIYSANSTRTSWYVYNNGTVPIYIGSDNTVTIANGTPIPPGAGHGGDDGEEVWAISGTAGQDARHWEAY